MSRKPLFRSLAALQRPTGPLARIRGDGARLRRALTSAPNRPAPARLSLRPGPPLAAPGDAHDTGAVRTVKATAALDPGDLDAGHDLQFVDLGVLLQVAPTSWMSKTTVSTPEAVNTSARARPLFRYVS
ncbi:hypothetical protein ACWEN3_30710, partial [Streptomyces sp. NPDC004561]